MMGNGNHQTPLWAKAVAGLPLPLRMLLVVWIIISLTFYVGGSESLANAPELIAWIIWLPVGFLVFSITLFTLWRGIKTIVRAILPGVSDRHWAFLADDVFAPFLGGVGALQIYMAVYALSVLWLAYLTGSYGLSIVVSCALAAGMAFLLFSQRSRPTDVKIFLIGGFVITAIFAIFIATVAVLPA